MSNDRKSDQRCALSRRTLLTLLGGAGISAFLPACSQDTESQTKQYGGQIYYEGLTEVARMLKAREISSVELTGLMLDRINVLDPRLKSYATVMAESAMVAAIKADQEIGAGAYRGSLHGVPIAVKDLCYTKGTRTMGGSGSLKDFVPQFDATVVTRLEQAGAILLGKLNLTEGAMAGYHPDFDIPVNPWDGDYWSGASSSGSGVATAAGLCFASLGSDTGGSIRFPSMANGIVGLKPTYGRVSRYGILPLAETLDHVGPMTRRTADAAIMFEAIAGFDQNDPTSLQDPVPDMLAGLNAGVKGLRVGYDRRLASEGVDPGLVESIDQALETLQGLGATVVDLPMPQGIESLLEPWITICSFEAHQAHQANFESRPEAFGPYFRDFLTLGSQVTSEQYAAASAQREAFNQQFNPMLASVDTVVCPAGGYTFSQEEYDLYADAAALGPMFGEVQMYFTIPADFAGTPTLTVPCGLSAEGLPYALQFMGPALSESLLCRFGHAFEEATQWHTMHPPV